MLNNEACLNDFNHCSAAEYAQQRLYVIARITTLRVLDGVHIADEERHRAEAEGPNRYARDKCGPNASNGRSARWAVASSTVLDPLDKQKG